MGFNFLAFFANPNLTDLVSLEVEGGEGMELGGETAA